MSLPYYTSTSAHTNDFSYNPQHYHQQQHDYHNITYCLEHHQHQHQHQPHQRRKISGTTSSPASSPVYHDEGSETSTTRRRNMAKKKGKAADDEPRRPLSAYNFYSAKRRNLSMLYCQTRPRSVIQKTTMTRVLISILLLQKSATWLLT